MDYLDKSAPAAAGAVGWDIAEELGVIITPWGLVSCQKDELIRGTPIQWPPKTIFTFVWRGVLHTRTLDRVSYNIETCEQLARDFARDIAGETNGHCTNTT